MKKTAFSILMLMILLPLGLPAQELPDPLTTSCGRKVTTVKAWERTRRPEIQAMFTEQMFGESPAVPESIGFYVLREDKGFFKGLATRRDVHLICGDCSYDVMMLIPNERSGKAPAFLGANFVGNDGTLDTQARRWPYEYILANGYAVVTFCYRDVKDDSAAAFKKGEPKAIATWAWAYSRTLDYLQTVPEIDASKVVAIGHSRLGKTALWAGATDQRFAAVISNDSGCGGAAISRRRHGETVKAINDQFPHWFADQFKEYNDNEDALPFDQHELIALVAPRPVYVASASEDDWADPEGEAMGLEMAKPVYDLYGAADRMGRHVRPGPHDILMYDWTRYIDFADRFLKVKSQLKRTLH